MFCEIEFLAVGEASKAGDAIVVRYGTPDNYELMLVDGGFEKTGETIVSHLKKYFGDNVSLNHIVLTHSDIDHASGLREVLREIPVAALWLHIPWLLSRDALHLFEYNGWTVDSLSARIRQEYDVIGDIVDIAIEKEIPMYYPFQGVNIGPFRVLTPRKATYLHLLPQFDRTPAPDQQALEKLNIWVGKGQGVLAKLFEKAVAKVQSWVAEDWDTERLKDGGNSGASNESSVVLYGDFGDGRRVLLTGDAGVEALSWAADYADACQLPLQQFSFVQIPHHGSRRNVGPTILNRVLGPKVLQGTEPRFTAFVSAPAEDDTHPRKMVLNAFLRRGAKIVTTQGSSAIHYGGFPRREDYQGASFVEFSSKVEAYD
jgi:beta-lactamase superfamily II metal-dependent hydrolase